MAERMVVAGGAGFLGSHLCERLLARGCDVLCVDNLITGTQDNLRPLLAHPQFRFLQHDITKPLTLEGSVSAIWHLASPASPVDYGKYPIQTLKVGALGTHHLLGLCREKGTAFLLASTSEVYGDPDVNPQPETYWGHVNPIGPRGVYDEAKRFAEAMTMAYHRVHGLNTHIVRIFNTYGPRMRLDDGRAVPTFIAQALRGKDLTVYGDGAQTRSFCYVDDLITGLERLMASDVTEPVNVGNPEERTILEIAQQIIQLTGAKSRVTFRPLPQDDPKTRRPDIRRATARLGWTPTVRLEEGLRRTIAWFRAAMPS